jgi:hypothetical protein
VTVAVIGATLAALAAGGVGVLSASAQGNEDNITICHRTDSASNPYSTITVDVSAVDGVVGNETGQADHFAEHQGPLASTEEVAQALKDAGIEWGDIIPAIPGVHSGLNLGGGGQEILENNCNFVTPTPPTQPPPTQPPPTQPPPTRAAPPAAPPPPPGPAARPPAPQAPVQAPAAPAAVPAQPRGVTG